MINCKCVNQKVIYHFLFITNNNVCNISHHLWDNHVWSLQCTGFEYLTLEMKIKNIDDWDKNWHANLFCQHAKFGTSRSNSLLPVTVHGICTDGHTVYDSITLLNFHGTVKNSFKDILFPTCLQLTTIIFICASDSIFIWQCLFARVAEYRCM